jgi:hypothetical protein
VKDLRLFLNAMQFGDTTPGFLMGRTGKKRAALNSATDSIRCISWQSENGLPALAHGANFSIFGDLLPTFPAVFKHWLRGIDPELRRRFRLGYNLDRCACRPENQVKKNRHDAQDKKMHGLKKIAHRKAPFRQ